MLGGFGKLAADGLAYRTEKATEEAGKNPRLLSTWAILLRLDWGLTCLGLLEADSRTFGAGLGPMKSFG